MRRRAPGEEPPRERKLYQVKSPSMELIMQTTFFLDADVKEFTHARETSNYSLMTYKNTFGFCLCDTRAYALFFLFLFIFLFY